MSQLPPGQQVLINSGTPSFQNVKIERQCAYYYLVIYIAALFGGSALSLSASSLCVSLLIFFFFFGNSPISHTSLGELVLPHPNPIVVGEAASPTLVRKYNVDLPSYIQVTTVNGSRMDS